MSGEIIILRICTINENQTMYSSWDMERDRQKYLILGHFLPFYPTNNQKIKTLKKWKK